MTARHYALIAAGVAAFTVYGSLVPFHYQARPWDDAVQAYSWAMQTRVDIASRSDTAANFLLGVPLGFCLLGAVRADKPGWLAAVLTGVLLWPWCVALAAGVEFAQLYFPGRTCSSNDVAAQAAGSAVGLVGWVLVGQRVTNFARRAWDSPRAGGAVGRFLLGYLALVALIQLLPLDITVSPADLYHKVRDKEGVLTPFGELYLRDGTPAPDRLQKMANWVSLVGLYLPVGMLAAYLPGRVWRTWRGLPAVAAAGLGLALVMEGGQLFVSRLPSTTDALFGGLGVVAGWAVVRGLSVERVSLETVLVLGQAWLVILAMVNWYPFDFGPPAGVTARLASANWVPLADSEDKDYISGLQELLQKATLFIPFGVLVVAGGRTPGGTGRLMTAAGAGLFAAAVLEFGQVLVPSRYPSVTDVVLGAAAAFGGAVVARRVRSMEAS